ncbi:MAG TPA: hypothetical protein VGA78_19005 [Gemmatimonadales bacterium]
MTSVFDRLRAELEQIGDKARDALEQARLQLEKSRLTRLRDDTAKDLGLLVYQKTRGDEVDPDKRDALIERLDDLQAQLARVDRDLAAVKGEEVSVGQDPAPAGQPADAEITNTPSPPSPPSPPSTSK